MFKLMNQEISFDVDISKVPCVINGALYLSEMSPTGSASALNNADAAYGTGYCDAQCPSQNFVNGVVSQSHITERTAAGHYVGEFEPHLWSMLQ